MYNSCYVLYFNIIEIMINNDNLRPLSLLPWTKIKNIGAEIHISKNI